MRLLTFLTAFLVGVARAGRGGAVIGVEGERTTARGGKDPGQAPPQAPQAQENPQLPSSGRYSFSSVEGGLLRLDNQSGEVAYCSARAAGWACEVVAGDPSASEGEATSAQRQKALLGQV